MSWVPDTGWLTQVRIGSSVGDLHYDLAVDASGQGRPSAVAAGLQSAAPAQPDPIGWLFGLLAWR